MALKIHSLLNDSDYILAITGIGHMGIKTQLINFLHIQKYF